MELIIKLQIEGGKVVDTKIEYHDKEDDIKSDSFSQYARFFDESSAAWSKDPECNLMFLKLRQNYANDLLKRRGYVFLNEVYDMLGIPKSKAGQVVGWTYNKSNPNADNYIDFGIYNLDNGVENRKFVNGQEPNILLDFNVDGIIIDRLD